MEVEIRGVEQLTRRLSRLSGALRGDAIGRSLLAGAYILEGYAKAQAPVDTGFLRSSIQSERLDDDTARVFVGAEYGAYLEYGTSRMAARPYMRPAADQHLGEIGQAVADTLGNELAKAGV
jgi:HK97 gp10 family phage protein